MKESNNRQRFVQLLRRMFQLDQPDLDFGLYRIMHAKADQVNHFLEHTLLNTVRNAVGKVDEDRIAAAEDEYQRLRKEAEELGAPDPDSAPRVRAAHQAVVDARESERMEAEIFDHLYRFFNRYYDNGDFMALRYYARETDGKAAAYSIPYDGREIYLHWANRDQFYIKTTEQLSDCLFDLAEASETNHLDLASTQSLRLRCRIVAASEGEHNNIKNTDQPTRHFIIHDVEPIILQVDEQGTDELVVQFEYRYDPQATGTEKTWKKRKLADAVTRIFAELSEMKGAQHYYAALLAPSPTDSNPDRTMLERYLHRYTSRYTMDYFIHKNLRQFLRRELDFYIKNEVVSVNDIESIATNATNSIGPKVSILKALAVQIIDFLSQVESFQKRLWLKKKFVIDSNYCITLDQIPEEFYEEIAENKAQQSEWTSQYKIDDLPDYCETLSTRFLKDNCGLMVDTGLFSRDFRDRLISTIPNLDSRINGYMVHSENYQALNLLSRRFRKRINCVYIDPPYNAQSSEILYKNSYKHSSWLTMMADRLQASRSLSAEPFVHIIAINEVENHRLGLLCEQLYNDCDAVCVAIQHNPTGQQGHNFSYTHEYAHFLFPRGVNCIGMENRDDDDRESSPDIRPFRNVSAGKNHLRESGANCFYPIYVKDGQIVGFGDVCNSDFHPPGPNIDGCDGVIEVYPIDLKGRESKWAFARQSVESVADELFVEFIDDRNIWDIMRKKINFRYKTLWHDGRYSANSWGSVVLNAMLPGNPFLYPKSIHTVRDCIDAGLNNRTDGVVLDYFAGSGTTGHAVVDLNRRDGGNRKYLLVEMGHHFDTVARARMMKAVYCDAWRNGHPENRHSSLSHCLKYIRVESYEDTLNNLQLRPDPQEREIGTATQDMMLNYWLDLVTRDSMSLLNVERFSAPNDYNLRVKAPTSSELVDRTIDLVETFNLLIGLEVDCMNCWKAFDAHLERERDPELPQDSKSTRMVVVGGLQERDSGRWTFRQITGLVQSERSDIAPERTLILWRNLPDEDDEANDAVLLEYFLTHCMGDDGTLNADIVYVNGFNTLGALRAVNSSWDVRLIESAFHDAMWNTNQ